MKKGSFSFRTRLFILLGVFVLLGGTYYTARRVFYRTLIYSLTQELLDDIATARVEKIGAVELDLQGNIIVRQAEAFTYYQGKRRLFYRAERMVLSLDGFPGRDSDLRVMQVDLYHPEIFIRRERDGVWNVSWVFESPKSRAGKATRPAPSDDETSEGFPPNGVHIHDGIIHVTTVGESGKEVSWTITQVRGELGKKDGVLRLDPCDGRFYGGRLVMNMTIPTTKPFSCSFQLTVTDVSVARLSERLELKRPVSGSLDGVLALRASPEETGSRPIAAGKIEITKADLWDVPVFLQVLSVLSLTTVKKRTIDTAQLVFTMEKHRIRIDQMDFLGDPVCLFGEGEMDLTGENLRVVFIPRLGRKGLDDIIPIIGTPIRWLLDIVKGMFIPVVMTGSFDSPQVSIRPGYKITTPVRKLIERKSPQ